MPKQTQKQTSPFCLRLTSEERALLEREAAGLPLGEYVRQRVFDESCSGLMETDTLMRDIIIVTDRGFYERETGL